MHTPEDHPDYKMLNKALDLADLNIKSIGGKEESHTSSKVIFMSYFYYRKLPMVGGSLRVLQLLLQIKLVTML